MVTNSASLGRYDDVKPQTPILVARADKVLECGSGDLLFDRAYVF